MNSISSQSVEPYYADVSTTLPDGTSPDPTSDQVAFAFIPVPDSDADSAVPVDGTPWIDGTWFPGNGAGFVAQILIGAGETVLALGDYAVWVKVTDSPAVPVLPVGLLTIY